MYLDYWQLSARPFENACDTRFFYPGESQQAGLLKLRYAVENQQACAALAGAAGLGKSLLVQALLRQVGEKCSPQAKIVYPQLPADQLLATIVDQLSGSRSTNTPSTRDSLARLEALLADNMAADRHAVIVVDEAHLLRDTESLQTLRLLLNFEVDGRTPLTLILVGQAGLLTTLERLPDFDQRIASRCVLRRFEPAETAAYVEHRLRLAGSEQTIFDNDALSALHRHSQGIPRKVNRLADLTLLVGFAEERRVLQAEHVEAVAEELTMPAAA